jgi:hypothetical protein
MFVMIGPLEAALRRQRCFSIRATGLVIIQSAISPGYAGILQADAYAGFNRLFAGDRSPGPIVEAACWAHARRKFFVLADVTAKARGRLPVLAPLALEAVKKIDAIFDIEREISGLSAEKRLIVRRSRIVPLVAGLEAWIGAERAKLSRHAEAAKAMDYMLKRWASFTRFLDDGRICLSTDGVENRNLARSTTIRCCFSFRWILLPRGDHSLIGSFSPLNVFRLSLANLFDPVIAAWSG